jgi:hypothetical protein
VDLQKQFLQKISTFFTAYAFNILNGSLWLLVGKLGFSLALAFLGAFAGEAAFCGDRDGLAQPSLPRVNQYFFQSSACYIFEIGNLNSETRNFYSPVDLGADA